MQTVQEKVPASEPREASDLPKSEGVAVPIMIPTKYSESILLSDDGPPQSNITYTSECSYPSRRSFRTGAEIVPRLRPKYHTSLVRVDGAPRESVVYHECVQLAYCMLMEKFSDTVNNFPCETKSTYTSTMTYFPNHLYRRYISSLEMEPAQMMTVQVVSDLSTSCNGQEAWLRPGVENYQTSVLINGTA